MASIEYQLQVGNELKTHYKCRLIFAQNKNENVIYLFEDLFYFGQKGLVNVSEQFHVEIEIYFSNNFAIQLLYYAQCPKCIWHNILPAIEN